MKKIVLLPVLIIFFLVFRLFFSETISRLAWTFFQGMGMSGLFLYQAIWYIVPLVTVMAVIYPPKDILKELGLSRGFLKGYLLAFFFTLPMFITYFLIGGHQDAESMAGVVTASLLAGFFEELFFRGFVFGQLFTHAKWGFIPAVLLSGLFFGIGHLYQSNDLSQAALIFGITFMGSAWFSWLYIESGRNLWLPIFLHVLMNLAWGLFSIDDTAASGLVTNLPRIVTIVLAILYILIFVRKQGPLRIRGANLWVNKVGQDDGNGQGQG